MNNIKLLEELQNEWFPRSQDFSDWLKSISVVFDHGYRRRASIEKRCGSPNDLSLMSLALIYTAATQIYEYSGYLSGMETQLLRSLPNLDESQRSKCLNYFNIRLQERVTASYDEKSDAMTPSTAKVAFQACRLWSNYQAEENSLSIPDHFEAMIARGQTGTGPNQYMLQYEYWPICPWFIKRSCDRLAGEPDPQLSEYGVLGQSQWLMIEAELLYESDRFHARLTE